MTTVVSRSNGTIQSQDNGANNPQPESYGGLEMSNSDQAQQYDTAHGKYSDADLGLVQQPAYKAPTYEELGHPPIAGKETNGAGDSWLGQAWGSVRETAGSAWKKVEDATLPFLKGEWDEGIGKGVRLIAGASAGVAVMATAKQHEWDKTIGAVVRKSAFKAADAATGTIAVPLNRRA